MIISHLTQKTESWEQSVKTLNHLRQRKSNILQLVQQYGITNIHVFGSVVRGEDNPLNDINFLVNLEKERTLFDIGGAVVEFQKINFT